MEQPLDLFRDTITLTKMDAARRQLRTAITLWFNEQDPVSVHTLAFAAYTVIHDVSRNRDRTHDLLFDSLIVKDERRREWCLLLKRHANFFKHANKDADAEIEFNPEVSEAFILFTLAGIALSGERPDSTEESAFMLWFYFNRPDMLTDHGRKRFVDDVPVDQLKILRSIPRDQFLHVFRRARKISRGELVVIGQSGAFS
jgi:hypothetical protein